jgi:hypothetical protein
MKVRNVARERLEKGEMSLGVGIRTARTVDIAKMMKTAGYDWLFIDLEQSEKRRSPPRLDWAGFRLAASGQPRTREAVANGANHSQWAMAKIAP